jgi:uncharacterized membrane-anchored protein
MIPWLKNRVWLALVIVALAQTGVLAGMVADRVRLLKTGREITLPIVPVDPRDFFRGEYVRLGYDIGRVPARLFDGPLPDPNAAFYVTLERKPDGTWAPIRLSRTWTEESSPDRIVLKSRALFGRLYANTGTLNAVLQVRYGIESYFVPLGEGPRLEALARDKKLAARIAVDKGGNAAIKGLLIDGVLQYEEPLF